MAQKTNTNMSPTKVNNFVKSFFETARNTVGDEVYEQLMTMWNAEDVQEGLKAFKMKKKKKKKDKNAPKRAMSAYLYFCADFRGAVKKELGDDSSISEQGKELGRLWNEAKYAGKISKYEKMAKQDKERHESEMENYVRPSDEEIEKQYKKKSRKSSGKRAKSAYLFFCKEQRPIIKEEDPDMSPREIMKELGKRWKDAKKGDISKWQNLANQDRQRILSDTEDTDETKKSTTKKSKSATKKSPTKKSTKKKKIYAYKFWVSQNRRIIKEETELSGASLTKELSKRWKSLTKEEKEEWKNKAQEDHN